MRTFLLESLREEQHHIFNVMERAARVRVPEAAALDWALESVITAYRDLEASRIHWWDAAKIYQASGCAVSECLEAIYDAEHAFDYEWQMAKLRAEASMIRDEGGVS